MSGILPFIGDGFFDPAAIEVMSLAYEKAADRLPHKDTESREAIAMLIIPPAYTGRGRKFWSIYSAVNVSTLSNQPR